MTYETLEYVDGSGATQEIALSGINLSANGGASVKLKFTPVSHGPSTFVITWPSPPEATTNPIAAIPFKSRCVVWACRASSTGLPNSFSAGTILFQGRRVDNDGSVSAQNVSTSLTLADAWWDLMKVTFQEAWQYISGGTIEAPTYSDFFWPDVILFQPDPGVTYSPAPVNLTITTWQQIEDILNYAIGYATGDDAIELQIGTASGGLSEFVATYCNWYPVRSQKCGDCLKFCLRPHPAVYTEIDYTTTPPTIHFRDRANMTATTVPYASKLSDGTIHLASDIKSLDELVPDAVRLYYKITGSYNGQPCVEYDEDIYPLAHGNSLICLDYSIDVTGESVAETIVNFVSYDFDPTDLTLWREKVNGLKQISQGGQIPNDGDPGALQFIDTTINGGVATHPDGIQITNATDSDLDPSDYPYHTAQNIPSWMLDVSGDAGLMTEANVTAGFSYQKKTGATLALTSSVQRHSHSMRLRLTNLPSGQYVLKQLLNDGEAIPVGLAESIYNELSILQWKLRHNILQVAANGSTVPTIIKPGKNMINLSGGLTVWETMNAVPEQVTIEFFRAIVDGVSCLTAEHTISCGPVKFLEPDYLVRLANLFWNRNHAGIDAHQRLTGTTSSNQVDLSSQGAKENSVPGEPDFGQQLIYGTDVTVGTNSNVFTIDGTIGQISVAQNKTADGTNYATGVISPEFAAAGSPSATTLAANAYYRVGMYYVDDTTPTNPVLWRCMTAGSNSTSVWAKISGGGTVNAVMYDTTGLTAYAGGTIAVVANQFTLAGVTVVPATYILFSNLSTPVSPTGNQIPQLPVPTSGTTYWWPIAPGLVSYGSCVTGGSETGLAAATTPF